MNDITFKVIGKGHIGKRHAAIIEELEAISESREDLVHRSSSLGEENSGIGQDYVLPNNLNKPANQPTNQPNGQKPEASCQKLITVLATPNNLHCTQAIEALKAGSHVLIEKPMGLKASECREVIEVAKQMNKKIFCVMQNRFSPPSKWLKELIGSGRLGKIYQVQVNCFWNRNEEYYKQSKWKGTLEQDGGTLFTQFSHFVDTLLWLFGTVKPVYARFNNFNHPYIEFEDSGFFAFEIEQGGVGTFSYSTSAYEQNLESSITILAEHGTVQVGGQYMEKVLTCRIKDYQMPELEPPMPPNDYGTYKGSASNHAYVYQNILDVFEGKAEIACKAEEGLKVVELIEEVYRFRSEFLISRRLLGF
ncbi:MAG: Gfo/Idh/MocA family oxidoreductase [Bacteroidia bacterium]|nr:Gfo/Idh/MocA family oxidoreductase [Bacteroidia bacterium]